MILEVAAATQSQHESSIANTANDVDDAPVASIDQRRDHKLLAFNVNHHPTFRVSYAKKLQWWARETAVTQERCAHCWLRTRECFCTQLRTMQQLHDTTLREQLATLPKDHLRVKIIIYYDPREIGRSANTAHIFSAIAPVGMCESIVFGDIAREKALIDEMEAEQCSDGAANAVTCVMYPTSDAKLLSDWVQQWRQSLATTTASAATSASTASCSYTDAASSTTATATTNSITTTTSATSTNATTATSATATTTTSAAAVAAPVVRLVLLDGTFPGASRQMKYLSSCCRLRGFTLPLVKLDLKDGWCKSAIAGVMTQPGKDKICSFQALAMALQQLHSGYISSNSSSNNNNNNSSNNNSYNNNNNNNGSSNSNSNSSNNNNSSGGYSALGVALRVDLDAWLAHILRSRVKLGKRHPRKSQLQMGFDNSPAPFILDIMKEAPLPAAAVGSNSSRRGQHRQHVTNTNTITTTSTSTTNTVTTATAATTAVAVASGSRSIRSSGIVHFELISTKRFSVAQTAAAAAAVESIRRR